MTRKEIVRALLADRKGILLAGESNEIENERLAAFGVTSEDGRRAYRELMFTTPGIEEHLSGIILPPEALSEKANDARPLVELISAKNIFVGASVSAEADPKKNAETFENLKRQGCTFALFSVATTVSGEAVSDLFQKNVTSLVRQSSACAAAGLVPALAVDVSMYGTHTAAQAEDAILEALSLLTDALKSEDAELPGMITAVSMAVSGSDASARADSQEVAERTLRALTTGLPENMGGVVFLSDAQNPEEGTANLNALARLEPLPWPIAFCFARALLEPVLAAWKGADENFADAQAVLNQRLALLSRADAAGYSTALEDF